MQEFTRTLIASFDRIDWCKNVGIPVGLDAVLVTSWDEAVVYAGSDENKQFGSDMANQIGFEVRKISISRYNGWNEVPRAVRPEINRVVAEAFSKIGIDSQPHLNVLAAEMKWNFMGWLIETEYSDILAPGYFTMLGELYKAGHFPCGWQGKNWPEGLPIVY